MPTPIEEMIDVLDANGAPTRQIQSKKAVHQQGLWHRTVHVWIVTPTGELLLQRRSPTMDTSPNCWDISSAGHLSAGESSRVGAKRELAEELGIHLDTQQLELLGTVHGESVHQQGAYINREYQDVYLLVRTISPVDLRMQDSEVSDVQLMYWSDLQKRVSINDQEIVPHAEEYQLLFSKLAKRFPYAHPA